jgi:hypothetical protein
MKKIDSWLHIQRYLTEAAGTREVARESEDADTSRAEEEPAHTHRRLEINHAHI